MYVVTSITEFAPQYPVMLISVCCSYECGALSSKPLHLMQYLGLHITLADPGYDPTHRSQLFYMAHVINQVVKESSSAPQQRPLSHVMLTS